jgi:glycosyltransferase involved in cell wall biosynthesis
MDHYHRAIKSRGIAERVLLTGVDPQVEKYYASADLLVLPAIQEAFGNVALEALASGLPVLVPQGSGASEILVGDLREGVLPNAAGPQEIAARVLTLLEHNRQSHLSRTAREVAEGYSWERNILRFEKVLGEVAATSSALNERLTMPRTRSREVRPQ